MSSLDSNSIPSVCYTTCNSAFYVAQQIGKSPDVCESTSAFQTLLGNCESCIDINAGANLAVDRSYLDDLMNPFTGFCSEVTIPTTYLSLYGTLEKTILSLTQTASGSPVVVQTYYASTTATSTLQAYFTHLSIEALISSYIPTDVFSRFEASVSSAASAASVTGDPHSLIYSALEDASLPAWFTSAIPATYTAQISTLEANIQALKAPTTITGSSFTLTSTSASASVSSGTPGATSTPSQNKSKAWIAGAVVGAVVVIALLMTGVLLFWRRRRRRLIDSKSTPLNGTGSTIIDKAQLHGDSLPAPARVYELDGEQPSRELPAVEDPRELVALEIPHEMHA